MTVDTKDTRDPLAELNGQARASYDEGDLQAAKQVWEAILQMDPDHEGARAGLEEVSRAESPADEAQPESTDESAQAPAAAPAPGQEPGAPPAFDPVLLAGLARAKEKIEEGEIDSARAVLDELAQDNPSHPEIAELRGRCEGGASPADAGAPPAFDLELDLDSAPPAAPQQQPGPPAAPVEDAGSAFDLDMELPEPAAPAAPAQPEGARELMDAVGELGIERPVDGLQLGPDEAAAPEPEAPETPPASQENAEAAALVNEARDALGRGDTQAAMQTAARAMALDENIHGAAGILDDARALETTRNDEAERHLTEGITAFEQGRAAEALPYFEKALELVPGHAEAEAYLAQVREQVPESGPSSGPLEFDGSELEGVESLPLVNAAPRGGASTGPLGADANTGPANTGPAGASPNALEPPPPVDIPLPGGGAPESVSVAMPPPPPAPEASPALAASPGGTPAAPAPPATPAPPAAPRPRARARGGGGSRVILFALLAVVAVGAGGWYAVTSLGLLEGGEDPAAEIMRTPVQRARVTPPAAPAPGSGQPIAEQAPAEPDPGQPVTREAPAPAAPSAPRYTRADVPRLMARADQALAAGRPAEAVELLVAAQSADPVNFDLIEKLEAARTELRAAEEAQARLEAGRLAFRKGHYDEALRIFYRVPATHRPEALDSWIALGWYNLGVRSLQSGNVHEALKFFNDSLDHAPNDPLTVRNREVAVRYSQRKRDEAYRIYVNSLKTRPLLP